MTRLRRGRKPLQTLRMKSLINGRIQLLYTAVANFTGFALDMRPTAVVEGVQVRRLCRPEVLAPKVHF